MAGRPARGEEVAEQVAAQGRQDGGGVDGPPVAPAGPGAAEAPPPSNTGVQSEWEGSAERSEPLVLVDWLGLTFPDGVELVEVLDLVGNEGWVPLQRGGNGYRQGLGRGKARVYLDGRPGMGTHIELSGSACRELEGLGVVGDWLAWLGVARARGGRPSRFDWAFDDRAGLLPLDEVVDHVEHGWYTCRGRAWQSTQSGARGDELVGRTVWLGSPRSATRVRIYDKAAEQGLEDGGPWVRVELQLRDERARLVLEKCLEARQAGQEGPAVVAGLLRGWLEFKERGEGAQRSLWAPCAWWVRFLGGVAKAKLGLEPVARSVEDAEAWVRHQVAPTLAMLFEFWQGDLTPLLEMASEGKHRWQPWHRLALATARAGKEGA